LKSKSQPNGLQPNPAATELPDSILESITDAFVALDSEFRYVWLNAEAERLLPRPRSEMLGLVIWDVYPELIGTIADVKCREALATRSAVEFENHMPTWDRWFFNKVYPTNNGGLVFFWREITEQKRAEKELRLQAAILDEVHDSIISTDPNGTIIRWNRGAQRIFGYSPEEAIGASISILYFAEDRPNIYPMVLDPLMRLGELEIELRNQRKDGEECFIRLSLSVLLDDAHQPYKFVGVATDITEQRRTEEKLRKSEEFHRSLIEAMPQIIFSTDAEGMTDMVGGRWQEYCGVAPEEGFGLKWLQWIHPGDAAAASEGWTNRLNDGALFEMVFRLRNAKGDYRWQLSRAVPVRDATGEIVQWVGSLLDVHDRVTFEESLRVSEESMRLAQTAAGIRHFNCVIQKTGGEPRTEDVNLLMSQLREVHAEDVAMVSAKLTDSLFRGTPSMSIGYRSVEANGAIAWRLCQAKRFDTPNSRDAQVIGVIVDVTAQKNAEEVLRIESERKRLESVITNLAEAVVILGRDGAIISANPAALRMHGFDPDDAVPGSFASLFETCHLDGSPVPLERMPGYRALHGETVANEELRIRNRESGHSWVASSSASPVWNDEGEIAIVVVSIRDMTAERAASEALQGMSAQLLILQDEERKRIAREIHDGTLQLISAMSMNLLLISKAPAVAAAPDTLRLIGEAQELAKRSSRELRSLAYILHPPDLDELGLVVALRSWADGFAQRTGIVVEVRLPDPGRLEPGVETALFRIAQESLANVYTHSGSATAELRLEVSPVAIVLEIRDSGRGMPASILEGNPTGVGVGIMGMRERVRQLGGALQIISEGEGTTVRASLPRGYTG